MKFGYNVKNHAFIYDLEEGEICWNQASDIPIVYPTSYKIIYHGLEWLYCSKIHTVQLAASFLLSSKG